jgi:tetratricopeptide (TPR) repeat protein
MARNKGRSKVQDDELIDDDEVIQEEPKTAKAGSNAPETTSPQTFVQKYRNVLLVGGAVVLAVVAYFVYNWSQRDKKNLEAQSEMVAAVMSYEQGDSASMARAINGDGQNASLLEIIEDYGSTPAGNLARYYAGTGWFALNNLDEGIALLEEYKKGNSMISAAAYGALGYAYEQKGEFEEAAKNYKEAASTPKENMYSTPFYLMHAGRNLESANQAEEALKVYKSIREKFPLSDQVRDGSVDRYIAKLSPEDFE